MGLTLGSIQGKYSYCNDERKQVLFSLNLSHGEDSTLILSSKWSKNNYAHSLKHIDKIKHHGYELLIFKTRTRKNSSGKTVPVEFEPLLEKRKLVEGNGEFNAEPIITSHETFERTFRDAITKSLNSSSEQR